jgi:hypothetical protein
VQVKLRLKHPEQHSRFQKLETRPYICRLIALAGLARWIRRHPCFLLSVAEGEFVTDGAFLQEGEGMTDADVVVCSGKKSGPVKVRSEHDKEVSTGFRGSSEAEGVCARTMLAEKQKRTITRAKPKLSPPAAASLPLAQKW